MADKTCEYKKMFNPTADDSKQKLFCGETTNILDLSSVKYPKFIELVDTVMYPNNWLPQKVSSMDRDRRQYEKELTEEEKDAYDDILSFLIFLDSVQTNNLPNIADYITLPEVVYFLARQTYEEAIHSRSYGYILTNMLNKDEMGHIVYRWRDNPLLLERNKLIAGLYDECNETRNELNFYRVLLGNYALEGLYFYNGFQFFHNLASRSTMIGTDTQIRYIQRDEAVHCKGFEEILKIYKNEENPSFYDEVAVEFFTQAVEWELKFSLETIGDKILGMDSDSIESYTYYLANKRLKAIGAPEVFPAQKSNPYAHLERIASVDDESSNRANQFETTSITYKSPEILQGWDEI